MDQVIKGLNKDLIATLEKIMSARELVGMRQDYDKELAELQCKFFATKKPDPQIEETKRIINERFEKIKGSTNEGLELLMDTDRCKLLLEELYGARNNKSKNRQQSVLEVIKNWLNKIKK